MRTDDVDVEESQSTAPPNLSGSVPSTPACCLARCSGLSLLNITLSGSLRLVLISHLLASTTSRALATRALAAVGVVHAHQEGEHHVAGGDHEGASDHGASPVGPLAVVADDGPVPGSQEGVGGLDEQQGDDGQDADPANAGCLHAAGGQGDGEASNHDKLQGDDEPAGAGRVR